MFLKVCNSANASPSKSGLSLNIKPSWAAPLASLNGSTASLDRHQVASENSSGDLLKCPLCDHMCKDPAKLELHVNRAHFDAESPAAPSAASAGSTASTGSNLNKEKTTPSSLPCPLCSSHYSNSLELERHVNREHSDILSPMTSKKRPSLRDLVPASTPETSSTSSSSTSLRQLVTSANTASAASAAAKTDGNGNQECCPVCNLGGFDNQNQLAEHIESHFNEQPVQQPPKLYFRRSGDGHSISSMSSSSSSSSASASAAGQHNKKHNDYLLAQELERRERERRKHEEQKEFDQLRAQFGMDNDGNFHTQSISSMQNAVYRGEMSVVDYYERQVRQCC